MEAVAEDSINSKQLKDLGKRKSKGAATPLGSLLFFAALGVLTSFLGYEYLLNRVDRELCKQVVIRLQKLYPDKQISVGRAHLDPGRSLIVEDISISTKSAEGWRKVLTVRQLRGKGLIDLPDLLAQKLPITKWEVEGIELLVWRERDRWSYSDMIPSHRGYLNPCDVEVKNGTIRLQGTNSSGDDLVFHDLGMLISPRYDRSVSLGATGVGLAKNTQISSQRLTKRPNDADSSAGTGTHNGAIEYHISSGTISSSFFKTLSFAGETKVATGEWDFRGQVTRIEFEDALRRRLPSQVTGYLSRLSGLECAADATFQITRSPGEVTPRFSVHGEIGQGRFRDVALPYPLEDLAGKFFIDNQRLQLRDMRASSGQATFELAADINGFTPSSPLQFKALAKNLDLDDRLYNALPQSLRRQWDRFTPTGRVDTEVDLHFDGLRWEPIVHVNCRGVSLSYSKFPYPITHLSGHFDYEAGRLWCDEKVTARANGQVIHGSLDLAIESGSWQGVMDFESSDLIPIDDTLIDALTPRGESATSCHEFIKNLAPTGSVVLEKVRIEKPSFDSDTLNREFVIHFRDGSVKFKSFPYPIHNINGTLIGKNDHWTISPCVGSHDTAVISCSGSWHSGVNAVHDLQLSFLAENVTLEEQLRQSLPLAVSDLWSQLQPKGRLRKVQVDYRRAETSSEPVIAVAIHQPRVSEQEPYAALSLQPLQLPYLLENVSCEMTYQSGQVQLHSIAAAHGGSHLQSEGIIKQLDGGWMAQLKWLPTTRLIVDSDLIAALPARFRETLRQIDFNGPVGVLGWSQFGPTAGNQVVGDLPAQWDLELDLEDAKLKDGSWVQGIRGTVRTAGYSTADGPQADGFVLLDSMAVRGVPLTNVSGPFAIRGSNIYFGRALTEVHSLKSSASVQPNEIVADAFSGKVLISGTGQFDPMRFAVQANLKGGQLQHMLAETGQASAEAGGICDAMLELQGSPLNPQTLSGQGEVSVREASLFQLPGMMKLLRFLSIKQPNEAAFEKADISFRIDGDRLPIDHFSIDGDMVSLAGSGWSNLRRELHLDLYAYVGNRNQLAKLVGPLLSETRYAPLMQVEVGGTVDAPDLTRKPLPVIEDALKTYFPERYANEKNRVLKF